jgi:hypothetical protein
MDTKTETKPTETKNDPVLTEIKAQLNDSLKEQLDQKFAATAEATAKLHDSIMAEAKKINWMGVGLGFASSVVITEVVDGFMATKSGATAQQVQNNSYLRGVTKLALAGVALWGLKKVKYFGKDGALSTAVLVGFDGVRDIIPFDLWIQNNIVAKITPKTTAGLVQDPARKNVPVDGMKSTRNVFYGLGG